jgi:hypothetical protein
MVDRWYNFTTIFCGEEIYFRMGCHSVTRGFTSTIETEEKKLLHHDTGSLARYAIYHCIGADFVGALSLRHDGIDCA